MRGRGFTIIEVLISIAVLGIVIGLAAPTFGEFMQNQQIRAAADAIQNGLQVGRAEAIRRNLPVKVTVTPPGTGWVVAESASGTVIQTRHHEEGSSRARSAILPANSSTVTFSSLGGTMVNADASPTMNRIDVDNPNGGDCQTASGPMRCLRVLVTGGGSIRMCDPKAAAPDPRAC